MTPERIEQIYDGLKDKIVTLHSDPVSQGPKYLQDLIARTRGYLNDVGVVLQEILQEKHSLERQIRRLQALFDIDYDQHLANNEEVTSLPSIDDRRAKANTLLSEQRCAIVNLETELADITAAETAVKFRHKELEHTMSAVRLQKNLIDTEISSGAMYGDETPEGRQIRGGSSNPLLTEEEMEGLFSDEEVEVEIEGEPEVEVEVVEEESEVIDEIVNPGQLKNPSVDDWFDLESDLDVDEDGMVDPAPNRKRAEKAAREEYGRKRPEPKKTPNGLFCVVCGEPQFEIEGCGSCCSNGHGGADGRSEKDPPPEVPDPQSLVEEASSDPNPSDDEEDLLDFLQGSEFDEFFSQ